MLLSDSMEEALNLAGFIIAIMNLEENLTQSDKQELLDEFNNKLKVVIDSIDSHLKDQDDKLEKILKILESESSPESKE